MDNLSWILGNRHKSVQWEHRLLTYGSEYHLVRLELPFRCSFPENVSSFPSLAVLSCLLLASLWGPLCQIHTRTETNTHAHTFPFLPSPKGSVWFMPFVRVWVGLKEIMVWLPWECGAFLNWCLFSHVHHIRPCSLEITHQSLGKSPLLQCQLGVQTTEVLVGAAFQKNKNFEKNRKKGERKPQIGASRLCYPQHTALFIHPTETTPQTCDTEHIHCLGLKIKHHRGEAAPRRQ